MDEDKKVKMIQSSLTVTGKKPTPPVEMSEEQFIDSYKAVKDWYLSGNVHEGERIRASELSTRLGIKRSEFKYVFDMVKQRTIIELTETSRAEYVQRATGEINGQIDLDKMRVERTLHKVFHELTTETVSFTTEGGYAIIKSFESLMNLKDKLLSKQIEMLKLIFGTTNPSNPIYQQFEALSGTEKPATLAQLIEKLDALPEHKREIRPAENLDMTYQQFMNKRAKGDVQE